MADEYFHVISIHKLLSLKYHLPPDCLIAPVVSQLVTVVLSLNVMEMFTMWPTVTVSYNRCIKTNWVPPENILGLPIWKLYIVYHDSVADWINLLSLCNVEKEATERLGLLLHCKKTLTCKFPL